MEKKFHSRSAIAPARLTPDRTGVNQNTAAIMPTVE
jgi:hypothetical protein